MALTVNMPQLGESVTEGTIAKWLKQPGEFVAKYESIAEVVTDKVNAEIPAPADGSMGEHLVTEGTTIAVGQPICTIETVEQAQQRSAWAQPTLEQSTVEGETASTPATSAEAAVSTPAAAPPTPAPVAAAAQSVATTAPVAANSPRATESAQPSTESRVTATSAAQPATQPVTEDAPAGNGNGSFHLTPAVRMLVREHGVDVAQVRGSGFGGRVTKRDVLQYVQERDAHPSAGPAAASAAPASAPAQTEPSHPTVPAPAPVAPPTPAAPVAVSAPSPEPAVLGDGDVLIPLTPIRKAIAEHMTRSKHVSPHAWLMVEVDMTKVARLRAARKVDFHKRNGVGLTFLPFVARATCDALREFPSMNASWSDEGVVQRRDIHLGIAVALEDNLIVPVVRSADRLTLSGLATTMGDLAERARQNRLKLDEITGGTFTLNNTGALGTVLTQPIINQPQAGILAMDMVVKRPVVVEGDAIAVRSIMNLCLSFDHRLNDGLQAARFLNAIKAKLESIDDSAML